MRGTYCVCLTERNIILSVILGVVAVDCTVKPANFDSILGWHSQVFIVPNMMTSNGVKCAQKGVSFCLDSFRLEIPQSERISHQLTDILTFENLVRDRFDLFNWFSLHGNESCCSYQLNSYITFGQRFHMSAEEYMMKATAFSTGYKPLNWIKALYDGRICKNIIVELGFGGGALRMSGTYQPLMDYAFQIANIDQAITFRAKNVRSQLTFNWFKHNIVCISQPWICNSAYHRYNYKNDS
ncbi:uncharacterized protein LOC142345272 [Convolutriloba macropyga]|uniref:uncharacterized protein LOC142345272 n=1 Tax=Convolutriloba macropyga TaxID=536237 RepID=UPI003F5237DB